MFLFVFVLFFVVVGVFVCFVCVCVCVCVCFLLFVFFSFVFVFCFVCLFFRFVLFCLLIFFLIALIHGVNFSLSEFSFCNLCFVLSVFHVFIALFCRLPVTLLVFFFLGGRWGWEGG